MKSTRRTRAGDAALVREALRRAPGSREPDVSRLVDAVPALMAEARRRRDVPLAAPLAERARRAIPRLAVATVVVVALGSASLFLDGETPSNSIGSFDSAILNGTENHGGNTSDVLLDAVMKEGRNDG